GAGTAQRTRARGRRDAARGGHRAGPPLAATGGPAPREPRGGPQTGLDRVLLAHQPPRGGAPASGPHHPLRRPRRPGGTPGRPPGHGKAPGPRNPPGHLSRTPATTAGTAPPGHTRPSAPVPGGRTGRCPGTAALGRAGAGAAARVMGPPGRSGPRRPTLDG